MATYRLKRKTFGIAGAIGSALSTVGSVLGGGAGKVGGGLGGALLGKVLFKKNPILGSVGGAVIGSYLAPKAGQLLESAGGKMELKDAQKRQAQMATVPGGYPSV